MGARAGKYKFGAGAGKYKFVARVGKYKFGARAGGREIQIPQLIQRRSKVHEKDISHIT